MRILVTAGPTREFIDPVRFLSNRSSGKMGYAVAAACAERGHDVMLISGPVCLDAPSGVSRIDIVSAEDMLAAVLEEFGTCDCLVMAAAVADWRPSAVEGEKIKKGRGALSLNLVATTDILGAVSDVRQSQVIAGFAAETGDPVEEAQRKLAAKGLDVIFANDVSRSDAGFEVDTNRIVCMSADGRRDDWPLMSKHEAGGRIAEVLEKLYESKRSRP